MFALGRLFNLGISATTSNTPIALKDCTSVGIIVTGATSGNVTIQEATSAAGAGAQNLARITRYYTQASGVWTLRTQAAAATVTCVTGGLLYVDIEASWLSDNYDYISASHSSATMVYVAHGLEVQRNPTMLAAWNA